MDDYQETQIIDGPVNEPLGEFDSTDETDMPDEANGTVFADEGDVAAMENEAVDLATDDASDGADHENTCDEAVQEMPTIADVVAQLDGLADLFRTKISRSEYEEQVLKRYSDEIHEYKADLYKKITLPLIKEVIGARDATRAILERARSNNSETDSIDIDSVEFISEMLETALDNHGVTVHTPTIGGMPNKATERPIGRVKTAAEGMHGTIAAVMNDAYIMDGKCIAPAKVKLFAYDPAADQQEAPVQTAERVDAAEDGTDVYTPCEQPEQQEEQPVEQNTPAPVYKPE